MYSGPNTTTAGSDQEYDDKESMVEEIPDEVR